MSNFDKDNLLFSVVTGFMVSLLLVIILWVLIYVWTFSPTFVVVFIMLTSTISYIVYKNMD